jgi:hypothetical protein
MLLFQEGQKVNVSGMVLAQSMNTAYPIWLPVKTLARFFFSTGMPIYLWKAP